MTDDQDDATTIRLNILGPLELLRTHGGALELPTTNAAHHLLALFAVKERYEPQQLVNVLWPKRYLDDERPEEAKAVRAGLHRALSDARSALELTADMGVLKPQPGAISRTAKDSAVTITSDLDDFLNLVKSESAEDWRAALALVRGPVAQYVPTSGMSDDWIKLERDRQKDAIKRLLARLDPEAIPETIETQTQDVLDGRWTPVHDDIENAHISEAPSEVGSSDAKVGPDPPPPTPAASDTPAKPRRSRRFTKRPAIAGLVVVLVVAIIVVVLSQSSHGASIPPLGAVVNAETGKVSLYAPPKEAHYPARIGGGPILRACNVATERPCKWTLDAPPISAHVGSVIEFNLRLHDTSGTPVPYLKLHATWQGVKGLSAGDVLHELEATVSVQWSDYGSESIEEPGRMEGHGHSDVPYVHIRLPYSGLYGLEYISGSSRLLGNKGELIHYLPDGITGYGIALQDVGSPPSCDECASKYLRFVNFRARVVAHSE